MSAKQNQYAIAFKRSPSVCELETLRLHDFGKASGPHQRITSLGPPYQFACVCHHHDVIVAPVLRTKHYFPNAIERPNV